MNSKYAIVTGASSGIGRELAIIAAREGYDLLLAADTPGLVEVAEICRSAGADVDTLEVDLATQDGVDQLYGATQGRAVDSAAPSWIRSSTRSATSSTPTSPAPVSYTHLTLPTILRV